MDFCGPEMDARRPSMQLCSHENSNNDKDDDSNNSKTCLTLNWVFQGKYHDYYQQQQKKNDGGGGATETNINDTVITMPFCSSTRAWGIHTCATIGDLPWNSCWATAMMVVLEPLC